MATKGGRHGGARRGAGRKPKGVQAARKAPGPVASAEALLADRLPQLLGNLLRLADGGYERVEEEWGYPDTPPAAGETPELVLKKRKVSVADADRQANVYLVDRVLGRPTERREVTETPPEAKPRIKVPDVVVVPQHEHEPLPEPAAGPGPPGPGGRAAAAGDRGGGAPA